MYDGNRVYRPPAGLRSTSRRPSWMLRSRRGQQEKERFSETVRTTYEQGETSYLAVLLNASNFSDLLSRLEIVSAIMDDNKKIVAEHTAAKEDIQQ